MPNTGTGNGYHDRGAVELQGGRTVSGYGVQSKPGGSSLDYTAPLTVSHAWPTDGPVGKVAQRFTNDRFYGWVRSCRPIASSSVPAPPV